MNGPAMRSRDYTQEVGIVSVERPRVSAAATTALFAVIVGLTLLFARQVNGLGHVTAETTGAPAEVKVSSR